MSGDFARLQDRQVSLAARLASAMRTVHARHAAQAENLAQHLALLDPRQVLARGYSMVQDAGGSVVSDASGLVAGAELRITFAQGWARTEVKESGGK